jgi:hypothetical protein
MAISDSTCSMGRKGLTKRLARLRDHISSMKERVKPSWPRNSTSQSMTAESSTPKARATQVEFV